MHVCQLVSPISPTTPGNAHVKKGVNINTSFIFEVKRRRRKRRRRRRGKKAVV